MAKDISNIIMGLNMRGSLEMIRSADLVDKPILMGSYIWGTMKMICVMDMVNLNMMGQYTTKDTG